MNTETTQKPDLSKISDADIFAAAEARKAKLNENRDAYKELVLEAVPEALYDLASTSEMLSNTKMKIFKKFEQILTLKNEVYGMKEKQRSHTFSCPTGEVVIGYRINDGWDDTYTVGVDKVKNALQAHAKDPESAILVEGMIDLLKPDSKGNLKASRILDLQKWAEKLKDPEVTDGVGIIAKAWKPKRSNWFIEAYQMMDGQNKISIPLAMSSVDFPATYSFDFFSEKI